MTGEVIAKSDVAVWAMAQVKAIDPDIAVGYNAVEFDEDALLCVGIGQREMLAIPTDAAVAESTGGA